MFALPMISGLSSSAKTKSGDVNSFIGPKLDQGEDGSSDTSQNRSLRSSVELAYTSSRDSLQANGLIFSSYRFFEECPWRQRGQLGPNVPTGPPNSPGTEVMGTGPLVSRCGFDHHRVQGTKESR